MSLNNLFGGLPHLAGLLVGGSQAELSPGVEVRFKPESVVSVLRNTAEGK